MTKGQSQTSNPNWPGGVRAISIEGLDNLGVDDEGVLYWQAGRSGQHHL
jgi:hypothetical protein